MFLGQYCGFANGFDNFAEDTPELAGAMAVWLSTEQASFPNGRFVTANWPVDELMSRKDETVASGELKVVVQGRFGIEG